MKKTSLLKPAGPLVQLLAGLAREMNEREETIALCRLKATESTSSLVCEMALQGQSLLKAKDKLGHGNFMRWLPANCPNISDRTARNYMRLAANWQRDANLRNAASLRQALQLCAEADSGEPGEKLPPKSWPPYLEALSRFGKFAGCIERHPLETWPREGREKLRDTLAPLAVALWPERFA